MHHEEKSDVSDMYPVWAFFFKLLGYVLGAIFVLFAGVRYLVRRFGAKATFGVPALVLILIIMGVYVWPTRYRYDNISLPGGLTYARIDRFTDEVQIYDYYRGEWRALQFKR